MNISGHGRPSYAPSKLVASALAVFSLSLSLAANAVEVVRGPYLQVVTPESVIVRWRTDENADARVRFGADSDALSSTAYSSSNGTEHEVQITGLQPNTRYYYDVGSSAERLAGDSSYQFVTAPVAGSDESSRIWVLGDPGNANDGQRAVRDGYKVFNGADTTNLVLLLGDNAYVDGTDSEYQEALFDTYPEILRQTPLYSTFGNHDGHIARSADESGPYYDMFTFPRNGEAGGVASGTEAYFSFDYGNVHFVNLNSYDVDDDADGEMALWLANDLAANDKDWIVAFWHHPAYTKGSHDSDASGSQTAMRENFLPILEQYGVDVVLSGHSHAYERTPLIDGHYGYSNTFDSSMVVDGGNGQEADTGVYNKPSQNGSHEGAVYIVNGASSRVSDSGSLDHPAMLVNLRELGSTVLDVNGNRMDVLFIGTEGETIDEFTITKGEDTTPPKIRTAEVESDTRIDVEFTEALNPNSAVSVANYSLQAADSGNVASGVVNAELSVDGRTVALTTTPLEKNVVYTLSVQNVSDQDNNVIAAGASAAVEWTAIVTISFQDGVWPNQNYAGARDTYLSQAAANNNYGSADEIRVDADDSGSELAGLLKWDISAIPSGAVIESASITLEVTSATNGVYNMYALNRDWSESGATWLNASSGVPWASAGARGSADHAATTLAMFGDLPTGTQTVSLNSAGLALLQDWVDGNQSNNGFYLYHPDTTDGLRFSSREETAADRPRLTITYSGADADGDDEPGDGTPGDDSEVTVSPPSNLEVHIVGKEALWIKWEASPFASGYHVWVNNTDMGVVTDPEIKLYGLQMGFNYRVAVTTVDELGNESKRSYLRQRTLAEDYVGPDRWWQGTAAKKKEVRPDNFRTLGKSPNALWIAWNSPVEFSDLIGYQVWLNGVDMGVVSGAEYQAFNLEAATSYRFDVAAVSSSGERSPRSKYLETTLQLDEEATITAAASVVGISAEPESIAAAEPVEADPKTDSPQKSALDTNAVGTVKFFVDAKSNFDAWTYDPSAEQQAWMRDNYSRMQVYRGYFDDRLDWYPNAWLYKDSYALKPDWDITSEHPEWALADVNGNMLYIPFNCSNGTCSQHAADVGNSLFRNWWMDELEDEMSAGHIGIWVDDVNLKWRVSNGDKEFVNPIDPRTGVAMTYADYQRYFAEFLEEIRARFPDAEIAHNTIWSTEPANGDYQYLRRQILAADYINLERGVTDGNGLNGGSGKYGFETFLDYVDWVHSLGRNVILDDDDSTSDQDRDLELAVYYLINDGGDLLGADGDRERMNPDNFWSGYQLNLGSALGDKYVEAGVFRRDFACGAVIVNQPDASDRRVDLPEPMTDLDGNVVTTVLLAGGEGEVLRKACAK